MNGKSLMGKGWSGIIKKRESGIRKEEVEMYCFELLISLKTGKALV